VQQGVDFRYTQHFGEAAAYFRSFNIRQGIDGNSTLFVEKKKKGAKGRESAGIGTCTDLTLMAILEELLDMMRIDTVCGVGVDAGKEAEERL
jgi:hypothetical protein